MQRIVVGMSGASGAIYGIRLLEALQGFPDMETHLVMTRAAERTLCEETEYRPADVRALASCSYPITDIGAPIASGSFKCMGMIVAPCSVRSLASIAYCLSDNLLSRAADVTLKERRRLILLVRETPLHLGHLRAMTAACEAGATIMPPVPAFYNKPATLVDLVDHTVARALDALGLEHSLTPRWGDEREADGTSGK